MSLISLTVNKEKDMVDQVVGPSATPFIAAVSHDAERHGHNNHGISGKDASFLVGEHTRSGLDHVSHTSHMDANFLQANSDRFGYAILHEINRNGENNHVATEKVGAAGWLATEKVGAANQLATEKIGAALGLAIEKVGAANQLATEKTAAAIQLEALRNRSDILMEMARCCCEIKEGQAATNALILSVESNRIRDELNQCRAELLARTVVPCTPLLR